MTEYYKMCLTVKIYAGNFNRKQKVIVCNIYNKPYTSVEKYNIFCMNSPLLMKWKHVFLAGYYNIDILQ